MPTRQWDWCSLAMLTVCVWSWGTKYKDDYIDKLRAGLQRHLYQQYRFAVCFPLLGDKYLTEIPGCFARLRMFDPNWQKGFPDTDRFVCIDQDVVITGSLDPLFNTAEPFMILTGANASNPCPYNGSLWLVRPGYRPDVWTDFSLEAAKEVPHDKFPDDQAWFAHKMPGVIGWKAGSPSGVYAFKKPGWPKGDDLPSDARLVAFPGHRDPSQFTHLRWIKEHWH